MELPLFFFDAVFAGDIITLNEDTSKHVVQVLRMKVKEQLLLTDGMGNLLTAQITDDHKKKCTVQIIERKFIQQKPKQICIAISLLKNANRFEWFLEKATEIGITEIIPLLCDRTEKQHFRFDRMKQILASAMLQSRQAWLPLLHEPTKLTNAMEHSAYSKKLVAYCEDEDKSSVADYSKHTSVQILIGPEGDFSADEISSAIQHNYIPVSLGQTRLRSETAGVVAATILCIS